MKNTMVPKMLLLAHVGLACPALAGSPFVTDDPEPVDFQHLEINTAAQGAYRDHGRSGAFPNVDANYGVAPDVQAHIGLALPFQKAGGGATHYGYGDTELGVKYRFIDEDDEGWRPQMAIYPNVELATGNAKSDLGSGYTRAFLPLWLQKSFGDWTTYGGGGYWLNKHADNRDYWFGGLVLQRKINDTLSLGTEIFEQGKDSANDKITAGFNIGGVFDIDDINHILFSAGTGLLNRNESNLFSYYIGYQAKL